MDKAKEEKITRFVNDPVMFLAVREVLETSFKKKRKDNFDVHYLAAKTLALEFLEEACKELSQYKNAPTRKGPTEINYV